MMKINLKIEPSLEELDKTRNAINNAIIQLVGEKNWIYELNLAIEEIIVNIIDHGTKGAAINVILEKENNKLLITIIDTSTMFDMTTKPEPDLEQHFKEYKKRGLGIFLIKNIVDNINHKYEKGKNILTITKIIEG